MHVTPKPGGLCLKIEEVCSIFFPPGNPPRKIGYFCKNVKKRVQRKNTRISLFCKTGAPLPKNFSDKRRLVIPAVTRTGIIPLFFTLPLIIEDKQRKYRLKMSEK